MLRTKVSCWFCSKESSVFILNKNSWTCEHCEQYNGFKKVSSVLLIIAYDDFDHKLFFLFNSQGRRLQQKDTGNGGLK